MRLRKPDLPEVRKILSYTIPTFGNSRVMPYGKLLVSDGTKEKACSIMDKGFRQYVVFDRKKYYVNNIGTLYHPNFEIVREVSV